MLAALLSAYFFDPRFENGKLFWIRYICIYCVNIASDINNECIVKASGELNNICY